MICTEGNKVEVLQSTKGYYIGTRDIYYDEGPYCRISEEYYSSQELAEEALSSKSYTERACVENSLCNGGHGCIP